MIAYRLTKGCDLKESIERICLENGIKSGVVISSVGSLLNFRVRLSDGVTVKEFKGNFEIISLNGTIANGASHLHISVSDENANCFGGHLVMGNLINTTCELVICDLKEYNFVRKYDENTKYKELYIERIEK